jgi:UDP-N-acetylmuramoyl-L-alanyl-D-glutamate--2,6-diaminopimelate ligase
MSFDLAKILNLPQPLLVESLSIDSRDVIPGSAYFAIKGSKVDGDDFIVDAIKRGAKVIISQQELHHQGVVCVKVDDVRQVLAKISSEFYQPHPEYIVGVTGTNGKTSVANFYRQIMFYLKHNAAAIGTNGVMINEDLVSSATLTTPDAIGLNKLLNQLQAQNVNYVALEASSHGLAQHRLDEINLTAAAFTNLSQDHLDYHHSMENYFAAKKLLFSKILPPYKTAVLNADVKEFAQLKEIAIKRQQTVIDYGRAAKNLKLLNLHNSLQEQIIELFYEGKNYELKTQIIGEFQAYNLLAAMGLAMACGEVFTDIASVISQLKPVPGRLERVGSNVFIDYAHTPDALSKALTLLRPLVSKYDKLVCVFGCGGNRDAGKRAMMGEIASKIADVVIITDDNPRFEDSDLIRAQIMAGVEQYNYQVVERAGRDNAIEYGVGLLEVGDILLIAGKGHEKYQIIKDQVHEFDDCEVARKYLNNMGKS